MKRKQDTHQERRTRARALLPASKDRHRQSVYGFGCGRADRQGPSLRWSWQDGVDQTKILRKVLSSVQSLQQLAGTRAIEKTLGDELREIATELSQFMAMIAPNHLYNEQNPSGHDHFSRLPAEIHEMILTEVSVMDLLSMQQVNRLMCDRINASRKIKTHMYLIPTPQSFFSAPFKLKSNTTRGLPRSFHCTSDLEWGHVSKDVQHLSDEFSTKYRQRIEAGFITNGNRSLPTLGARCRRILICQPPLTSMEVRASCCSQYQGGLAGIPPIAILKNPSGITLGDVWDQSQEIKTAHRLCPNACASLLDAQGYASPRVAFKTRVPIHKDDPAIWEWKSDNEPFYKSQEPDKSELRLQAYTTAKRIAQSNGLPIPTLAEFDAANARKAVNYR